MPSTPPKQEHIIYIYNTFMELEILNEILTGTISLLFRGKWKEIEEQIRASLAYLPPPSISDWIKVEGKHKLDQSLRKLGLDYMSTNGRDLGTKSYEDLTKEKNKVKSELKSYDTNFKNIFSRTPGREEKEPMRPLYVYYKKLKLALTRRANEKPKVIRICSEETIKRIIELRKERNELNGVLKSFNQEFEQTNHRRIKCHDDIIPVKDKYKRLKEIKVELSKLEGSEGTS